MWASTPCSTATSSQWVIPNPGPKHSNLGNGKLDAQLTIASARTRPSVVLLIPLVPGMVCPPPGCYSRESGQHKCTDSVGFFLPGGTECIPGAVKCQGSCVAGSTPCYDTCCGPGYSCIGQNLPRLKTESTRVQRQYQSQPRFQRFLGHRLQGSG